MKKICVTLLLLVFPFCFSVEAQEMQTIVVNGRTTLPITNITVSDSLDYTKGGNAAVYLIICATPLQYISVTVLREDIQSSAYIESIRENNYNTIGGSAQWGKFAFTLSSKHNTSISFHIRKLDLDQQIAEIEVRGIFVDTATYQRQFSISTLFLVEGENFRNLIAKP